MYFCIQEPHIVHFDRFPVEHRTVWLCKHVKLFFSFFYCISKCSLLSCDVFVLREGLRLLSVTPAGSGMPWHQQDHAAKMVKDRVVIWLYVQGIKKKHGLNNTILKWSYTDWGRIVFVWRGCLTRWLKGTGHFTCRYPRARCLSPTNTLITWIWIHSRRFG